MPTCLFCKRPDIPRVPLTPTAAAVLVAHVDGHGDPCLEGTAPEVHAQMLGDYPHFELLDDDDSWILDEPIVAVTVQPADSITVVAAAVERETAELPPELPDVEPTPAPERPARARRKRKP